MELIPRGCLGLRIIPNLNFCENKQEHQEEKHGENMQSQQRNTLNRSGIKLRTFLLWDNTAKHCTTFPSKSRSILLELNLATFCDSKSYSFQRIKKKMGRRKATSFSADSRRSWFPCWYLLTKIQHSITQSWS